MIRDQISEAQAQQVISSQMSTEEKKKLADNWPINTNRFLELIWLCLGNVEIEESEAEEILRDLKSIEHDKKVARINRLEQAFYYAETKYKYVYGLIKQINSIIGKNGLGR